MMRDQGQKPSRLARPDDIASAILAKTGPRIGLAMPLGLGKAVLIANALYARAKADPTISLRIFTALTLEKPRASSALERAFIEPLAQRLFGNYPGLDYASDLHAGRLPANVEVNEFFFQAGNWLSVPLAQQSYISANYTHAGTYVLESGVNVIAQLVAPPESPNGNSLSLSCNPDLTLDLLAARKAGKADFLMVGEIHPDLPFMGREAELAQTEFDILLDAPDLAYPLFAPPREPVSLTDYAIGLHAARLIPDGGTLQIGIGSIGDAIGKALVTRHHDNPAFRDLSAALPLGSGWQENAELTPFAQGLYGASEMLVECFIDLIEQGIVKRSVDGVILHAGFFLGSQNLYRRLRAMPRETRDTIAMSPIAFVNDLYGYEAEKRTARVKARFCNSAMMVTLLGATVSDGLEDGRIVSGVGGQYNFVAQAFALDNARSIIMLRATRETGGKTISNIVWNYGHTTIPRHLRDIVITEYGVADLRGKKDADVIASLLAITDSRFQDGLLARAKAAGKIAPDYAIPDAARNNTPARIKAALGKARAAGLLSDFPFGSDFTDVERALLPALAKLKSASSRRRDLLGLIMKGMTLQAPTSLESACLDRMGLSKPSGFNAQLTRLILRAALNDA